MSIIPACHCPHRSRLVLAIAAACVSLSAVRADAIAARLVAVGSSHTCIVTAHGTVQCWGDNSRAQLGNGTTDAPDRLSDVVGLTGVVALTAGAYHTCALTAAGAVKCWGANYRGQLGDGTIVTRSTPVGVVLTGTTAVSIAAGAASTCAVTAQGGVKCWGWNGDGQLGDGSTLDHTLPADVSGLTSGVSSVTSGYAHGCAVKANGTMSCWGSNVSGQLGDGTTVDRLTPVAVTGLTGVAGASAGGGHTCALTQAGGLKCWGDNSAGELGDGTTNSHSSAVDVSGLGAGVSAFASGFSQTCAVTAAGVKCWGYNAAGELGDGTTTNRLTPTDIPGSSGATAIDAGGDSLGLHTCAVTWQGHVLCWGDNQRGQVGSGYGAYRKAVAVTGLEAGITALSVGEDFGCAVTSAGGVRCWGRNWGGQLGDGTNTARSMAADVSTLGSGIQSVSSGAGHACALTTGGGVKCWGWNGDGQLGNGTTTDSLVPVQVSGLTSGVLAVAVGIRHTCALVSPGSVRCWGGGGYVGDGTTTQRLTPTAVSVPEQVVSIATAGHTCVATISGKAYCWGGNDDGQLGNGTTTATVSPVQVSSLNSGVVSVSVGSAPNDSSLPSSSCAVMNDGTARCWGNNEHGQLGDGTTTNRLTPVYQVSGVTGVTAVSIGPLHGCALVAGGAIKCWGVNGDGQLGDGTTTSSLTAVATTAVASATTVGVGGWTNAGTTCALSGTTVYCWGQDEFGQVGSGRLLQATTPYPVHGFGPASSADFDGDWKIDPAVYRPAGGTWFWLKSSLANQDYGYAGWGVRAQNDAPVVGDFDGDGLLDQTVFRPSTGTWFVRPSGDPRNWYYFGWGTTGDVIVAADYDGDGVSDAAVYRPSTGTWYIRPSSNPGASWSLAFGNSTDTPLPADYDGDGKADLAVYRSSTGTWFICTSSTNYTSWTGVGWGVQAQGDTPAPADFDGDGIADITVYRPASGTWFIRTSSDGGWLALGWGQSGDTPMPADYDGDGAADLAVYRPSTGQWFVHPSSGATQWSKVFGTTSDVPLRAPR
jgi:alpha-tubulin suppressor-like RCC1 family protein